MSVVVLRADASVESGFGNLERMMILAREFQARGSRVRFVCREDSLAPARLREKGFSDTILLGDGESESDAIFSAGPGLVVFDVGDTEHERLVPFHEAGVVVVTFDDRGDGRYLADIVVDANLTPDRNPKKMETTTEYLLGSDYVVLSREVRAAASRRRKFKPLTNIILSFGGSDPAGASVMAVESLAMIDPEIDIELVVGAGFSGKERLNEALLKSPRMFSLSFDPPDLPQRMAQADLGVFSAGLTMSEAACLGLPSVIIAQDEIQARNVEPYSESEGVKFLGVSSRQTCSLLPKIVKELADVNTRRGMSERIRKVVDGKGVSRIMESIRERIGG